MEEYKTYTLEEISKGKGTYGIAASAVEYDPALHTYLRITDINDDGTLNKSGLMSVDEDNANDYLLKPNDIVFARTGNSTGRAYFYDGSDGELVFAGFLIKFSLDSKKVNPRIIKYYTHSKPYYDWVQSFDTGGTRGNINAKTYGNMPIVLPSRSTQDKIVEILKFIDDKIDVNKQINDNLEKQAYSLFTSWFVDFEPFKYGEFVESELGMIPKGWSVGSLSDVANVTMGTSPAGSSYNVIGEGDVFYQGRAEFGFRFPTRNMYTTEAKRFAEIDSVLLSVRAPVGDVNVAEERCCIGRGLASVQSKVGNNSFMLYLMQNLRPVFDRFNGEGTVFGCINKKALEDLTILIPDKGTMDRFDVVCSKMDGQIKILNQESRRLAQLRDSLLPRLMSGELKVNEIENINC